MAVAFVAMGSWAAFANAAHPLPQMLHAGVVQGSLSALITLGLKRMIQALSRRLPGRQGVWLPPLLALAASSSLLLVVHRWAGTPELARTIALPLLITTLYSVGWNLALRRQQRVARSDRHA